MIDPSRCVRAHRAGKRSFCPAVNQDILNDVANELVSSVGVLQNDALGNNLASKVKKIQEEHTSPEPSDSAPQAPPPSSGKDTTEEKDSGPKNKPFIPPKKKDPNEAKQAAQKAVSLADKHKMQANIRSLAKIMVANCENPDSLQNGFAYFGHGGQCHLVVEMTPGLTKAIKTLTKKLKADKGSICDFLEKAINSGIEEMPKSKRKKAKLPKTAKGKATSAV